MKPHLAAVIVPLSILGLLCLTLSPLAAVGQGAAEVNGSKLKKLSAAEVAKRKVLSKHVKSIEAMSDEEIIFTVKKSVCEISSETVAELFPKWTFYVVPFEMEKNSNFKGKVSIAFGLYDVLGARDTGEMALFPGTGNHDDFGEFLAAQKVPLRNVQEGKLVWTAMCQILRSGSPPIEPKMAGPNLWHLGEHTVGKHTYFYEVHTTKDGIISSGILKSQPITPE